MFTYNEDDPYEMLFNEKNLFHFSIDMPNKEFEINELFRRSLPFREFYTAANKLFGVSSKEKLEIEWNTALSAGANASTYYRLLANKDIFPYFEYKVILGDDRCKRHEMLDGCVIRYDDPICSQIIPPNSPECCCFMSLRTEGEVNSNMLAVSKLKIAEWQKETNIKITFNY